MMQAGFGGPHHYIGLGLFCALFVQNFSGFYHHVLFKKHGRRTWISYVHLILGWIIILLGWINTALYGLTPPENLPNYKLIIKIGAWESVECQFIFSLSGFSGYCWSASVWPMRVISRRDG
jgi:hypothetical protein